MIVRNLILAATIAVATASTPALAAGKHRAGFNAYGAVPGATESMNTDRAKALRDCAGATSSMRDYTWGVQVGQVYRSCMADHGQPE